MKVARCFYLVGLILFLCTTTQAQTLTSSNLPIVIITIDGNAGIPDEPKVLGTMKIIYTAEGQRNFVSDKDNPAKLNYNGRVGIEIRGSSSSWLEKKQYSLTTLKADNVTNNNVSLLGMPAENDWILSGLAFDASFMRDYLSFNLSRAIGQYAPRTQHCELILNGNYRGIYMLVEKIKTDDNRVNVVKMDATDNAQPDLSGGYITKSDKIAGVDVSAWNFDGTDFIHEFPKANAVTVVQNQYISSVFYKLKNEAINQSVTNGYPSVIDVPSFIDFMLINELGSNADAYQFSTYFHKDKNGKLRAGPVWDLNLTYGYDLIHWGYDRSKPDVWQFRNGDNEGPVFWKNLFDDNIFKCYLAKRWNELTQPGQPLSTTSLNALIDATATNLTEAAVREHTRWDDEVYAGTYTNFNLDKSLTGQVNFIKSFIAQRQVWMTTQLGSFSACSNNPKPPLVISRIDFRPATSAGFPQSDEQEFIEITNAGNQTVSLTGMYFGGTGFVYQFPAGSELKPQDVIQLANKREVFIDKYNYGPFDEFTRSLSNTSQKLTLVDAFGNVIDEVLYSSEEPWPNANGNGNYLKLIDLNLDNAIPANWMATNEPIQSTVVGLNEPKHEIQIFPNPVTDVVKIKANATIDKLTVVDAKGIEIQSIYPKTQEAAIDLRGQSTGLYMFTMQIEGKNVLRKVIKK